MAWMHYTKVELSHDLTTTATSTIPLYTRSLLYDILSVSIRTFMLVLHHY